MGATTEPYEVLAPAVSSTSGTTTAAARGPHHDPVQLKPHSVLPTASDRSGRGSPTRSFDRCLRATSSLLPFSPTSPVGPLAMCSEQCLPSSRTTPWTPPPIALVVAVAVISEGRHGRSHCA